MKKLSLHEKTVVVTALSFLFYFSLIFTPRFLPSNFIQHVRLPYELSYPVTLLVVFIWGGSSIVILLYRKLTSKPLTKSIVAGATALLSTIIIFPSTTFIYRQLPRPLPIGSDIKKFDSIIWQDEASTEWNEGISIREQMLKDVIINVLPGKSKDQIKELLGPSLETNYFRSIDKDFIYYLGPERDGFMNIDSEWLLLWLDEKGKYKRYQIVND